MYVILKDGHGPSLKSIIEENQMKIDGELKIMSCKHASSSSAIQAMADIGRQFAIIKSESKKITAINIPSGYGLKGEFEYQLD